MKILSILLLCLVMAGCTDYPNDNQRQSLQDEMAQYFATGERLLAYTQSKEFDEKVGYGQYLEWEQGMVKALQLSLGNKRGAYYSTMLMNGRVKNYQFYPYCVNRVHCLMLRDLHGLDRILEELKTDPLPDGIK